MAVKVVSSKASLFDGILLKQASEAQSKLSGFWAVSQRIVYAIAGVLDHEIISDLNSKLRAITERERVSYFEINPRRSIFSDLDLVQFLFRKPAKYIQKLSNLTTQLREDLLLGGTV